MARTQGKPLSVGSRAPMVPSNDDPSDAAIESLRQTAGVTRTDTGWSTAISVQVKRDLKEVERAILYEAQRMGESFVYSWEVNDKHSDTGKSRIEGMSIDGALILIRNWKNAVVPVRLVQESPTHYLIEAQFIDLENGFTIPRLFRQRKSGAQGNYDIDRKEDLSFQIGQSKAQRNAIKAGMPSWLIEAAIEAAKGEAAKKYDPPEKFSPAAIKRAATLGVTEAQLVARVGKPVDAWSSFDLVYIAAAFRSIREKQSSIADEFPPVEEAEPEPPQTVTVDGEVVVPSGIATIDVDGKTVPFVVAMATEKTPEQREQEEAELAFAAKEEGAKHAPGGSMFSPPMATPPVRGGP